MTYRNHKIEKIKDKYHCKELNLYAGSLKYLIGKINKAKGYPNANIPAQIKGGNRVLYINMNPLEAEEIMKKIQKIKVEKGLENRKEVLKFLISLYEVW